MPWLSGQNWHETKAPSPCSLLYSQLQSTAAHSSTIGARPEAKLHLLLGTLTRTRQPTLCTSMDELCDSMTLLAFKPCTPLPQLVLRAGPGLQLKGLHVNRPILARLFTQLLHCLFAGPARNLQPASGTAKGTRATKPTMPYLTVI